MLAAGHALLALSVADIGVGGSIALLVPGHAARGRRHGPRHHAADLDRARQPASPQHAGAAAGALSTMQQVGNALGVAVTGVIFFGALDGGFGHAFEVSLIQLAAARARRSPRSRGCCRAASGVSLTRAAACRARA